MYRSVNWNTLDNSYVETFWNQNIRQFWIDTEYLPSKDIDNFNAFSPVMKEAFMRVLAGLTLLDTLQSHTGMAKIIEHVDSLQCRSVIAFMCMMETIHAKSYSTIFTTVASTPQINAVFDWSDHNEFLQYKAARIDHYYRKLDHNPSKRDIYMALCSSVFLETYLFYSGFFLPLWLAGSGLMVASSDIIKKIIADESIHGVFIGLLAQDIYKTFDNKQKESVKHELDCLMTDLYENEKKYTLEVYGLLDNNMVHEVNEYIKYNGNKAMMNLGFDEFFSHEPPNPIIINGLNTESTQHDFFSKKSTNYEKVIESVQLEDSDFQFGDLLNIGL